MFDEKGIPKSCRNMSPSKLVGQLHHSNVKGNGRKGAIISVIIGQMLEGTQRCPIMGMGHGTFGNYGQNLLAMRGDKVEDEESSWIVFKEGRMPKTKIF
jgi:hypothetical protein